MRRRDLPALAAGAAGLCACSPLTTFDTLAPKDGGVRTAISGAAYGGEARQRLDVYAPKALARRPLPMIVFFYGGSWDSGRRQDYEFAGTALAALGAVAVVPDYRLVPAVRFPAFVEDGAAAVAWAHANAARLGADPGRIVLAGHSAGAYIAAMLALDPQWLAKAGFDRGRLAGWVGLAGPYDFLPLRADATRAAFGDHPDLEATQPLLLAGPGAPATLLLHGLDDDTVRPRNSEALAERLRAAGVAVSLDLFKGVDHVDILLALSRPLRRRAPVLERVKAFAQHP